MRRAGFTGSRKGMTQHQLDDLIKVLEYDKPFEFHHGDCVGADWEAAEVARSMGIYTVAHPPENGQWRARHDSDEICAPAPYQDRNRAIVNASTFLIAAPAESHEVMRSGTWSTVRYARSIFRLVTILYPDGD